MKTHTGEPLGELGQWLVAEGKVESVLAVLDARGVDVPDSARARISECHDHDQLDVWVRRVGIVRSVDELFA